MPTIPDSKAGGSKTLEDQFQRGHDGSGHLLMSFEVFCVTLAAILIVLHVCRFAQAPTLASWWTLLLVFSAWLAADFASGLIHWGADTWGKEDMWFLGPRFLRPFRVHHVTPRSFLECGFFDTNGDTALLCLPGLTGAFFLSLSSFPEAAVSLFIVCFCVFGAPTNQIHQWAHMDQPPRPVRWLQYFGLILSPDEHERHHQHPHISRYCITSGICNYFLDKVSFFPAMERLITNLTGSQPRSDEENHIAIFQERAQIGCISEARIKRQP